MSIQVVIEPTNSCLVRIGSRHLKECQHMSFDVDFFSTETFFQGLNHCRGRFQLCKLRDVINIFTSAYSGLKLVPERWEFQHTV
uniref:Uncharacterized protein n=1 Tax=Trichuris muris TaxID=70415 RepID=A0A5S6Q435_TRIMR